MAADAAAGVPGPSPPGAITTSIFGGLRIWRGGEEIDPGPPRQRIVLAMLLAASGSVIGIAELVDALWESDPPSSAVNQVQRIVGQLRRTLEPGLSQHAPGSCLVAAGAGYRIADGELRCDLYEFRGLTRDAEAAIDAGDLKTAASCYLAALELARRPVLPGLDPRTLMRPEFLAVEQERVATAMAAADLALAVGSGARSVIAVTRIADSAPFNEPLQARLIRLLAAAGRGSEALKRYDTIRHALADELGVDPGTELRDAYRDLLGAGAPAPLDAAPAPAAGQVLPAQLPRSIPGFVHRADGGPILMGDHADFGPTVVITALGGMGGIGKTALAVEWAHRVIDQFPDGQLYLNLRGFDPGGHVLDAADAVDRLLEALGQSLAALGDEDLQARSARYRSLMAGRRMIVLLDNARDAEQVRPLLPGSAECLVLITSRNRLASLVAREGARYVPLGRLTRPEATSLLAKRLGAARVSGEPLAVADIVENCAGLPLALAIVAARIATTPGRTIAEVAAQLFSPRVTLDALSVGAGRDDIRSVFSWSYEQLSASAARVFRLLAAHPGPELSLASVASTAGLSLDETRRVAGQLISAHLLEEPAADRFTVHDLLRVYASELLDSTGERPSAERRVVAHFLRSVRAAYLVYGRPAIHPLAPEPAGLCVESFADVPQTLRWWVKERAVLMAVAELALERRLFLEATVLVLDWRPMNQASDLPGATVALVLRVLAAAPDVGEPALEAELNRDAGARSHDDPATAERFFRRALELYGQLGDAAGQANAYRNLAGFLMQRPGEVERYVHYSRLAVDAARRSGRPDVLGVSLLIYTTSLGEMGLWSQALEIARESINVITAAGIEYSLFTAVANLARCYQELGYYEEALQAAERAVAQYLHVSDPIDVWELYSVVATAALASGKPFVARDACDRFDQLRLRHGPSIDSMGDARKLELEERVASVRRALIVQ